jgi:tetratricopeptide (TPR) repeat protein
MESGDYETAEPMVRESLEIREAALGSEHPAVAASKTLLANCLIAIGEYDEALDLAAEARTVFANALSEDHWRTAVAISAEGAALAGQGKFADAEPLLLQSFSVLNKDPSALPLFVDETMRRLESLYVDWGKPDRAAEVVALADD